MGLFNYILYFAAALFLVLSFIKDKAKTKLALKKAWKSFENILPQFLSVLIIIGMVLALVNADTISMLMGDSSGWLGVLALSVLGSITLIPGFIAFPLAATLLKSGAGYMQLAAFISTLMMVGIVTLPVETKFFGKKVALLRNGLAYVFSLAIEFVMGVIFQ